MNRLLKKPETPKEQGRAAKPSLRSRIRHEWLQLERTRHWAVPGLVVTAIAICWLLFVVVGGHSPVSWLMTPDQQGERLMAQESYEEAAERFDSVELKGSALYRAGDFKQAAEVLARTDTPVAAYNRGTAQIILGEYDAAIASLDRALELRPEWKEAKENRAIAVARKKALEPGDGPREQGTEVGADGAVRYEGEWKHGKPVNAAKSAAAATPTGSTTASAATPAAAPAAPERIIQVVQNQPWVDLHHDNAVATYRGLWNTHTQLPCKNGTAEYEGAEMLRYEGCFNDAGQFHGKGRLVWLNEDVYEGDFELGNRHGSGQYRWSD